MIKATTNLTKKELFNAKSNTLSLKEAPDEITIRGVAVDEITDIDTGFVKHVTYLFEENGIVYGSISESIFNSITELIDLMEEINKNVTLNVNRNKSMSGREFLTISIN